jgi:hypothetical protein
MSKLLGSLLLLASAIVTLFVALSGSQWKSLLLAHAGTEMTSLPVDVYAAAALAFFLGLLGTVTLSSGFKPVTTTGEAPHECVS